MFDFGSVFGSILAAIREALTGRIVEFVGQLFGG